MPLSQFTVYMSADSGSPVLTGLTGSLISLLDACLVNGYASKPAAGWSKPSFPATSSLGAYQQASGSRLYLYVNDSSPVTTSVGKEAWATGWEIMTSYTSSAVSASVGAGNGQFPLPSQVLTTGHYVIRKSSTADSTIRQWIMFADAYTLYLFIANGDTANTYSAFFFGDIFSLKPATDSFKCLIAGRVSENVGSTTTAEGLDIISLPRALASGQTVHYLARSFGGFGQSVPVIKLGDGGKIASALINSDMPMGGNIAAANPVDNSYYMAPIWIAECAAAPVIIRGRMRGMYMLCHPITSFADGQVFSGANEYAGKSFVVIKQGQGNNIGVGYWVIETSATLETN